MRSNELRQCRVEEDLKPVIDRIPSLSHREREVLLALPSGSTNAALAQRLSISERTVRAHVGQILIKLDIESRVRAAVIAYAWQSCCQREAH